ncbi:MAG: hypothetical protein OEV66_08040 [Spirochaetia bacterium]|nr:hypothetical protein [Spirochaetia bacterium]
MNFNIKEYFLMDFIKIFVFSVFGLWFTQGCGNSTDCSIAPPRNIFLTTSTKTSVSHNAGMDCITGCHDGTGAVQVWAAAGSIAENPGSLKFAPPGSKITNVGGSALETDKCGNFYAASTSTLPGNTMPTSGNSGKTMGPATPLASCNLAACHDGSSTVLTIGFNGGFGVRIY